MARELMEGFDLTPRAIIEDLRLRRPIYSATSVYGHFGREGEGFPWEEVAPPAETGGRLAAPDHH